MAVNTDKYIIESKTLVGELMPYFLRGKKFMLFMTAISSPLDSINKAFREWCRDAIISAVTTSQVIVLKWSMKERLKQYFQNENDDFSFLTPVQSDYITVYENQAEQTAHTDAKAYMPEDTSDSTITDESALAIVRDRGELTLESNELTIVAPIHNSKITDDEYVKIIKQCFEPYLVSSIKYQVATK